MQWVIAILLFAGAAWAADDVVLPDGFENFYNLEFDTAIRIFREATKKRPQDPEVWNNLAEGILYNEMLKAGALESELVSGTNSFLRRPRMPMSAEAAREFQGAIDTVLKLTPDPRDTPTMYANCLAHGLRSNWNFLVHKAWMDALRDATAARKTCNRIDPSYVDARLAQGAHDYLVGSLPWTYRMLGILAGIHGDREGGIRTIQLCAEKSTRNRYDAQVMLAAIYRRERMAEKAIPLVSALMERFPRNYLFELELAQMYADLGNKDEALAVLGKAKAPQDKVLYYRATVQFWYNDLDDSLANFRRIEIDRLDLNAAILVWIRIGQIHDLKGMRSEAKPFLPTGRRSRWPRSPMPPKSPEAT